MANVKVVLKSGEEKFYQNAEAQIGANRVLRVFRPEDADSLAEFQSEYYQYWEYTEEEARKISF